MSDQFKEFEEVPAPVLTFGDPVQEEPPSRKQKKNRRSLSWMRAFLQKKRERWWMISAVRSICAIQRNPPVRVGTQKKMADFSENALKNVRTKDLGEVEI